MKRKKRKKTMKPPESLEDLEKYISLWKPNRRKYRKNQDISRKMNRARIRQYLACVDCQNNPVVFIVVHKKKIGLCARDWRLLAKSTVGWASDVHRNTHPLISDGTLKEVKS